MGAAYDSRILKSQLSISGHGESEVPVYHSFPSNLRWDIQNPRSNVVFLAGSSWYVIGSSCYVIGIFIAKILKLNSHIKDVCFRMSNCNSENENLIVLNSANHIIRRFYIITTNPSKYRMDTGSQHHEMSLRKPVSKPS